MEIHINFQTFRSLFGIISKKIGLDTIAYLPDPRDNNSMQPIVTFHARFTGDLSKDILVSKETQKKFNKWDKKNDYKALEFLLDSLSQSIKDKFEPFHNIKDPFFVKIGTSSSYNNIQDV